MKLLIVKHPDPILKEKSSPVEKVTEDLRELSRDMFDTMETALGLGLSAVQVGRPICLITLNVNNEKHVLFNPKILQLSNVRRSFKEGCLSFPGIHLDVKRPIEVKVSYLDVNNKKRFSVFKGLEAVCFLHEYDHLQGVLFTEKAEDT